MLGKSLPDVTVEVSSAGRREHLRLSSLKGRWHVLFFYPKAGTSVCQSEVVAFNSLRQKFEQAGAHLLGISVDPLQQNEQWAKELKLGIPLGSDESKTAVKALGILNEVKGNSYRATYILDPEGRVRFLLVQDNPIGRSPEEVLRVLRALQSGQACPVGWTPAPQ